MSDVCLPPGVGDLGMFWQRWLVSVQTGRQAGTELPVRQGLLGQEVPVLGASRVPPGPRLHPQPASLCPWGFASSSCESDHIPRLRVILGSPHPGGALRTSAPFLHFQFCNTLSTETYIQFSVEMGSVISAFLAILTDTG